MAKGPEAMILPMLCARCTSSLKAADTMMSKFATGDFEERIFELERKSKVC